MLSVCPVPSLKNAIILDRIRNERRHGERVSTAFDVLGQSPTKNCTHWRRDDGVGNLGCSGSSGQVQPLYRNRYGSTSLDELFHKEFC